MANKDGYEYESCLLNGTVGIGMHFLQIRNKFLKVLEEILLLN